MTQSRVPWLYFILVASILLVSGIGLFLFLKRYLLPHNNPLSQIPQAGATGPEIILPPSIAKSAEIPKPIIGIGIMGDSNSDEYRADDNRGGTYAATTLNWVELLALNRDLNFGKWDTWGEPRRTGFEYNWARSGATAQGLIDQGQHTGLAEQITQGKISQVILYIGGNDFHLENGSYQEIYDGSLSDTHLQEKIDSIIENITLAVDTVINAGDVQVVVVNIADKGLAPDTIRRFPNRDGRERVSAAIKEVDDLINKMAAERGIVVVDLNAFAMNLLPNFNKDGTMEFGGEFFHFFERGNTPQNLQLDDASGHPGTILSGILANSILVGPFNEAFGLDIRPLSADEIFKSAGLH